ncbi:deoxyribose-phosphate aldolase [Heyndrickxia coagulans]|uniref:Deoxyribose-phosphate aldolase n=1 Tax=Heyndrickxia coagulans DSM 1 = ATCC 7050 TaxID=1121088 RepID=A0A8B4BSD6_HEYCO|nr:deoxyribose-phosphate aldolase [Heyndrickxia coagulans]AJH77844.1 deoxyribose-phosphate aldolase [Heyndrickxia coagulans DSM 1 = ATCC 7050]MCR2846711.1 deoxyribose-phosphate aldolase [Heyndrickxia coagulans]MDR4223901.1 deoxyribose-phosphate aldolase [Heyndrickxia coagulans DSM 1 = ATCC 7050]MED4492744.1 deoxyribose-phosphate aldolase [Heyndrickxia coagulans]MED4536183.1 deoxyribose-phosphate aldolase [Heyndrickxia coagulans]
MANLAAYIDHTLLKPEATEKDILKLTAEAAQYHFASVCIHPYWVKLAARELAGTGVKVCTVIGFPLGATTTETKAFETKKAIGDGADEIDMVINIGALKSGNTEAVEADIRAVVEAAQGKLVKVIIETCLLTNEEKELACRLSVKAGAHFVKTSTGFSTGGATVEDVKLMRQTVGDKAGVKASGGIHTKAEAEAMIEAGATRIGASSGVKIVSES